MNESHIGQAMTDDEPSKPRRRRTVSSATRLMLETNQRSLWFARWRSTVREHEANYGGAENMSVPRASLLHNHCALLVEMEQLRCRMANDSASPEDIDQFARLLAGARKNYAILGLDRVAKPVDGPQTIDEIAGHLDGQSGQAGSGDGL